MRLKADPRIRFAGQITGCEGYVESASIGLMAGRFAAAEILQAEIRIPPHTTALGSILNHVSGGANSETFQPMNINFGLFPPPTDEMLRPVQQNGKRKKLKGKDRKKVYSVRALEDLDQWLSNDSDNIKTA